MHQSSILWEERDLTNSSAERIILVESSVLVDHILTKTIRVIEKLRIDFENVERNLKRLRGLNLSEAVMIALTKKGLNRQEAHALVREISMRAYSNDTSLLDEILKDERIMAYFSREELENILKPENYLGTAKERVEMVVEWVSNLLDGYD